MAFCFDTFIITVIGSGIDASITSVEVTIQASGSGSQPYHFAISFSYVCGEPPATAFSVVWTADQAGTVLPTSWYFSPPMPSGLLPRSTARNGLLTGQVPAPTVTTTYTGTLTIHQE